MIASASSWKHEPFTDGLPIPFSAEFNNSEFSLLKDGVIPERMEDKWFIYYEEPYLLFYRSWTGKPVYRVTLKTNQSKIIVSDTLWAAEFATTNNADLNYQAKLLDFLISNLLLKKNEPFPLPTQIEEPIQYILQHHISDTGYHEILINPEKI